eukprot:255123_1
MSNTKRKRSASYDEILQNRSKRQRLSSRNIFTDIFGIDITNTIFDHLSLSHENYAIFMIYSTPDYMDRRSPKNLNQSEVTTIKHLCEGTDYLATIYKFNLHNALSLYSNLKKLFDHQTFRELIDIPLCQSIIPNNWKIGGYELQFKTDTLKVYTSDTEMHITELVVQMDESHDLTNHFSEEHKEFILENNLKISECYKIIFTPTRESKFNICAYVEGLPYAICQFQLIPTPTISMISIYPNLAATTNPICREICTRNLLPSIEILLIHMKCNDDINIAQQWNLHIDHDSTISKLEHIEFDDVGDEVNNQTIHIELLSELSDNFGLINWCSQRNIAVNVFDEYPLEISTEQLNFIRKCKGMKELNFNKQQIYYGHNIIHDGLINAFYCNDIYVFKVAKIKDNYQLLMTGFVLRQSQHDTTFHLHTSAIPTNWTIMGIGNAANRDNANMSMCVTMDSFSNCMEEFSIFSNDVELNKGINYNNISNNLKKIRLSYNHFDYVAERFTYMINKKLESKDLPYCPITFLLII